MLISGHDQKSHYNQFNEEKRRFKIKDSLFKFYLNKNPHKRFCYNIREDFNLFITIQFFKVYQTDNPGSTQV